MQKIETYKTMKWRILLAVLVPGVILAGGLFFFNHHPSWNEIMIVFAIPLLLAIFSRRS